MTIAQTKKSGKIKWNDNLQNASKYNMIIDTDTFVIRVYKFNAKKPKKNIKYW